MSSASKSCEEFIGMHFLAQFLECVTQFGWVPRNCIANEFPDIAAAAVAAASLKTPPWESQLMLRSRYL